MWSDRQGRGSQAKVTDYGPAAENQELSQALVVKVKNAPWTTESASSDNESGDTASRDRKLGEDRKLWS